MPNVFGSPSSLAVVGKASSSSVSGSPSKFFPLVDPRAPSGNRSRFRREMIGELSRANSLYVPAGRWPARGWILLRREDFVQINPYSVNLQLQIDDFFHPALTLHNLTVVQARCVTTGLVSDDDSVYLVEITDRRGVLWNTWVSFPTQSFYNVRAPAYLQQFYSGSTVDGTNGFTWNQMVADLWNQMGTLLGPYPGLPVTPADTPEGYSFPGTSCWEAMHDILDLLGCQVSVDLTKTTPYGIANRGANDPAFNLLTALHEDLLEDDLDWLDAGSGRVPLNVRVFFHRRNQYYGTEETVRPDALQWSSTPFYSVLVQGPFQQAAGTHTIWSDFTVRYDTDGNPLAADVTTANAIAASQVNQYFNRISDYRWRLYAGLHPFAPGAQLDGVCWRENYEDGYRKGWLTETITGANPPWSEVTTHAGQQH